MKSTIKFVVAITVIASLSSFADESVVVFRDCPKCKMEIKLTSDGKTAYINSSRMEGATREERVARAKRLMSYAILSPATDVKRPLMGWSSWNTFGCDISEDVILECARAMATNGLKAAGYVYVNIDDGFFNGHGDDGVLRFNPERFPNGMKPVVDGIHALGMKAGIYSDAGSNTCASIYVDAKGRKDVGGTGGGLYGHDAADCKLHFIDLGFDFIKVDYCGALRQHLDERQRYTEISKAIRATGRTDVRFNICRWAFPGVWAADIAESWRTTGDIRANWKSLRGIIKENLYLSAYARPGAYNDMDMMEVGHLKGQVKTAFGSSDKGFTADEEALHFGVWCLFSSPLLIGCDARAVPDQTMALVTNPYLLAMSQNDLGLQAEVVQRIGDDCYVMVKDADERFGRSRYVALINLSDNSQEFTVEASTLELAGKIEVFDLMEMADPGSFKDAFTLSVRPHSGKFFRFDAEKRIERTVYEAECAFLNDYQEMRDAVKLGTAHPSESKGASGGVTVRYLGNRESNWLEWRNVNVISGGPRRLTIRYSSPEERALFVSIDGGEAQRFETKSTDGGFSEFSFEADLSAGLHKVRISNPTGWTADIDSLFIAPK